MTFHDKSISDVLKSLNVEQTQGVSTNKINNLRQKFGENKFENSWRVSNVLRIIVK